MASNDTISDEDPTHALLSSFIMIIFSEIGDKTFLIAAILAMKHPRMMVFAGAFGSLVVMSILSAMMGRLLPALLPKSITELAAALLFFVFGWRMLLEGREMKLGNQKLQEEMKEAQEEIEEDDVFVDGTNGIPLEAMEEGGRTRRRSKSSGGSTKSLAEGCRNFFSLFLGPVFVQAFVLTFLGEWGDRSQISTIALGAAHVCSFVLLSPSPHAQCLSTECIPGHNRHRSRPCGVYGWGSYSRPVHLYQDRREIRCEGFIDVAHSMSNAPPIQ